METVAKMNGSLSFQGHRNNKEKKVGGEMLGECELICNAS